MPTRYLGFKKHKNSTNFSLWNQIPDHQCMQEVNEEQAFRTSHIKNLSDSYLSRPGTGAAPLPLSAMDEGQGAGVSEN
jgi:hypothetical protein